MKRDFIMLGIGALLAVGIEAAAAFRTGFNDITDTSVDKWYLKVEPSAAAGVKWQVTARGIWDATDSRNGSVVAERIYNVAGADETNFKTHCVDKYMEQLISDEELPPATATDF